MRFLLASTFAAAALILFAPAAKADVSVEVDISFFHERLSPHGTWVEVESHGWCWQPRALAVHWRPYTHGHWVYVDEIGWYWESDYDWGWACFHYGRWTVHGDHWVWVPGYEWSGAWVAWRHGGGHVGWAALPPGAKWEVGVGISTAGFSFEADIRKSTWVLVEDAKFTSTRIHSVAIATDDVSVVLGKTKVLGSVSVSGGVAVNHSLKIDTIKPAVGEIKKVKLTGVKTLGAAKVKGGEGEVRVFRPKVDKRDVGAPKPDAGNGARKTMREKHEAEADDMKRRHERDGTNDEARKRHERERGDMEKRHQRERDEMEKHGRGSDDKGREKPERDDDKGRDRPERDDDKGRDKPERDDDKGRDKPGRDDKPGGGGKGGGGKGKGRG